MAKLFNKKYLGLGLTVLALAAVVTFAAVTVSAGPTNLVTSDIKAKATSQAIGLFRVGLDATAGETLSSMAVTINNSGTSAATSADLASLNVYRDDGDNILEVGGGDVLVGSNSTVNVGSATTVTASSNNTLPGTFFVTLATSASWSDSAPSDSVTANLAANAIVTSANSPTIAVLTTSNITADTTGPVLTMVEAKNTGSAAGLNAGDSLEFTFGEATNKPALTASQLNSSLVLSGSHSYLDGLGIIASETWNAEGTKLTVVVSGNVTLPTVMAGDTVAVSGSLIVDALGNTASGSVVIGGSFSPADSTGPVLTSVVAANTGLNVGVGAGDTVLLTFNEATNKPVISSGNINTTLGLNNSHTWLDGSTNISSAVWNVAGTQLTVTLSAGTSVPTIAVGDLVAVSGSVIKDAANNNATGSVAITGTFGIADTTGPALNSAVAMNSGNNSGLGAGDTVVLTFNEATNKPVINNSNIAGVLVLNNSHAWLDGAGSINAATWNGAGTVLTVTLSAGTSAPTIAVGDTVTITGSTIKDAANNSALGTRTITGNFSGKVDDEDNDHKNHGNCDNGLLNGRIYRVTGDDTYYLAAHCSLKVFHGAAVLRAMGFKFQNIIQLSSLNGLTVNNVINGSGTFKDKWSYKDDDMKAQGQFKIKLFGNHQDNDKNKDKHNNDD